MAGTEVRRGSLQKGGAIGCAGLGLMYLNGQGVKRDYPKAKELLEQAAAQGNALGQVILGMMYLIGQGVEENPAKAKELLGQAAKQGSMNAREMLETLP